MQQKIFNLVKSLGYNLGDHLNSNDERQRFFVYKIRKGSSDFVLKIANQQFKRDLENEIWWNMTLLRLAETDPKVTVRSPHLYYYGPNWYIGEFFDVPQLVPTGTHDPATLKPHLQTLATILADLDGIALQPRITNKPLYETSNSAPYSNLLAKVDDWMVRPLEHKLITEREIRQAKALIEKYRPRVTPTLQHGDFVPWHMYVLPDAKIGIIDGEHSSLIKPRYYDLAYLYTRLFTRLESDKEPSQLLKLFLETTKPDQAAFIKTWLPVITLRSLGMYNDAIADLKYQDYRPQAKDLLTRCFSEKLNSFLL